MKTLHYFIDTETSGLRAKDHALLEISIIKQIDRVEVDRFYAKIQPCETDILEPEALRINGLTPHKWSKSEALEPMFAASMISDFVEMYWDDKNLRRYVVGHNVGFDVRFIRALSHKTGIRINLPYTQLDTKTLSACILQPLAHLPNNKLDTIRAYLGMSQEGAHSAEKDCEDMIEVFDLLTPRDSVEDWAERLREVIR